MPNPGARTRTLHFYTCKFEVGSQYPSPVYRESNVQLCKTYAGVQRLAIRSTPA